MGYPEKRALRGSVSGLKATKLTTRKFRPKAVDASLCVVMRDACWDCISITEAATTSYVAGSHSVNDPDDFFTPHPGVGLFLFADGSVHAVRTRVPVPVLQALSTPYLGEVINSDDY
jgi:hypothetical protein